MFFDISYRFGSQRKRAISYSLYVIDRVLLGVAKSLQAKSNPKLEVTEPYLRNNYNYYVEILTHLFRPDPYPVSNSYFTVNLGFT